MNYSYRNPFSDALPVASDQSVGSCADLNIAAQRQAIPSPLGRGLGEGKETVDRSLRIGSHIDVGSISFLGGTSFSQIIDNQCPNFRVHGEPSSRLWARI
jgi:hypothetical protein